MHSCRWRTGLRQIVARWKHLHESCYCPHTVDSFCGGRIYIFGTCQMANRAVHKQNIRIHCVAAHSLHEQAETNGFASLAGTTKTKCRFSSTSDEKYGNPSNLRLASQRIDNRTRTRPSVPATSHTQGLRREQEWQSCDGRLTGCVDRLRNGRIRRAEWLRPKRVIGLAVPTKVARHNW